MVGVTYSALTSCGCRLPQWVPNYNIGLLQNFLGWLSRPDIFNRLSVINLQPGDVTMAATSLAEAAAFGTRKTGTKRTRTI